MARLQPDYKAIEKTKIEGLSERATKGLLYYYTMWGGDFPYNTTYIPNSGAERKTKNYKIVQLLWQRADNNFRAILAKYEQSGKKPPKVIDAPEVDTDMDKIDTIPRQIDTTLTEYQQVKEYYYVFNFWYDLFPPHSGGKCSKGGLKEGKELRAYLKSEYGNYKYYDYVSIKDILGTFINRHQEELTNPLSTQNKRDIFNAILDYLNYLLQARLKNVLQVFCNFNGYFDSKSLSPNDIADTDKIYKKALENPKADKAKLDAFIERITNKIRPEQEIINNIKNPYPATMPVRPTGARLPILEYKEGVKTPTDKITLTTLFDNHKEITGRVGGLDYTITHFSKPLNKANLFNLLIIGNCYLHRDTENQAINNDTPLIIPFSEIARAKNAGEYLKMHKKDIKKFDTSIDTLTATRIRIKVSYPDSKSKKGQNLFAFYNHLEPDATYLLQADFQKDPTTGEKYLAITKKPAIFEILRKSGWVEKVPLAFYGQPLQNALKATYLQEDTQATAFLLFSYLITKDRIIGHKYKKMPKTFNIDFAKLYEVIGSTKKIYNEITKEYEETKVDYSELSKADRQNFRRGIIKFLSAFSTIAQEQKDQDYYRQYPFLSILPQDKALYLPAYNTTTQKAEGLSIPATDTYSRLLKAKTNPQK